MLYCKDLSSHMFLNLLRYNFVCAKIWLSKMIKKNDTKELNLNLISIIAYVSLVISAACIVNSRVINTTHSRLGVYH